MFQNKEVLLLDMNSTFMFGEDRFGSDENYSIYYQSIGGESPPDSVNFLLNKVFDYLACRYPTEEYRHGFPSLRSAIEVNSSEKLSTPEINRLIETFSFHEHGEIPDEYVEAITTLHKKYTLALVVDIWAPKDMWINTLKNKKLLELFAAYSFSSDHGIVKPSPKPFELIVQKVGVPKEKCLVIGDSVRRDLGGANAAGMDCVLIGGADDPRAIATYSSLLEFCDVTQLCG